MTYKFKFNWMYLVNFLLIAPLVDLRSDFFLMIIFLNFLTILYMYTISIKSNYFIINCLLKYFFIHEFQIPTNLLRAGRVFVFEPPPGVSANLLRTFSTVPASRMCKVSRNHSFCKWIKISCQFSWNITHSNDYSAFDRSFMHLS